MDYITQLQADLDAARQRAADGVAARGFLGTPEGQLIQEWINLRVSYLMEKLTGKDPLSDRDYLAIHGGIRELKDFNVMLQSKAAAGLAAEEEVKVLSEQHTAATS